MTSDLRERVDAALAVFLDVRGDDIRRTEPSAAVLIDEVRRLLDAGGKRVRPAFCYWGYVAAGGEDDGGAEAPIVRASAALELLHTMAIVHDDLMDGAKERRGVPTTAPWFSTRSEELGVRADPDAFGLSTAVLVGDLAAVLADRMLLESGFPSDALDRALAEYHPMRERMAVGQYLDLRGAGRADGAGADGVASDGAARRAAALRGGAYTVPGPLLIGAALAAAAEPVRSCLARFGGPLGEAFQLRDDLDDGDAPAGVTRGTVAGLVGEAKRALDPALLQPRAVDELRRLADMVAA